jgi:hypothetical protein
MARRRTKAGSVTQLIEASMAKDGAEGREPAEVPMSDQDFGELVQLVTALQGDAVSLFPELEETGSESGRRQFVRAFFANVEALNATFRQIALSRARAGLVRFSAGEMAALRGVNYRLTLKGPRPETMRESFEESQLFAWRAFAKAFALPLPIERGQGDWQHLMWAVRIRNRLAHPKRLSDMRLTLDDSSRLAKVADWWWGIALGLMNATNSRTAKDWTGQSLPTTTPVDGLA